MYDIGCLLNFVVDQYNIIDYSIFTRLIEFVIGIVVAKCYLSKKNGYLFNSRWGLLIGIAIAFFGRILMSSNFHNSLGFDGVVARVFDLPLLTAGMGLVIINTLQHRSYFTYLMESRIINSIGKYSYSMYLWHWFVAAALSQNFKNVGGLSPFLMVNLIFLLSIVILYPVSKLSYVLLESSYFRRNHS